MLRHRPERRSPCCEPRSPPSACTSARPTACPAASASSSPASPRARLDAEVTLQPWMMAPNGYLHAASVLLLADTSAGYASFAHLPDRAKNFTTIELKSNFLGTAREGTIRSRVRRRAPRPDDARLVGDRVRSRRQAPRPVPLHAADPVVSGAGARPRAAARRAAARGRRQPPPLGDREIDELQALLDAVPAPLEPLDVSSLDGFLCGVIVQPKRDRAGALAALRHRCRRPRRCRPASTRGPLHALVARRDAELRRAIARREWFDPWVFELDAKATAEASGDRRERRSRLPLGRRLRRGARDLSRPARGRRRRADRAAGAALPPSRRRRPRGRRRAARRDRDASSRRPTSARRSRSSSARRCCWPTSRRRSRRADGAAARGGACRQIVSGSTSIAQRRMPLLRRAARAPCSASRQRQPGAQHRLQRAAATPTRPASACARRRRPGRRRAAPARRPSPSALSASGRASAAAASRNAARRLDRLRLGAQHREVRERRQAGALALLQLAGGEGREVVPAERLVERMRRVPGLHPHLARRARCAASRPARPAACISSANSRSGARKSLLNSDAVGIDRGDQADAAEVVALGDHLRADQDVDLAGVDGAELRLERALPARAVGVDAGDRAPRAAARRAAPRAARCRGRSARCRGCRTRGRRAAPASARPQWWQRSVRSCLWKTRQALQCGQPLIQPHSPQCSTGA